jgi:hypothetical protein
LGQGRVLLGGKRAEAVAGLRGDDDGRSARRDDVAELFQDQGCSVQVDGEDDLGCGLTG